MSKRKPSNKTVLNFFKSAGFEPNQMYYPVNQNPKYGLDFTAISIVVGEIQISMPFSKAIELYENWDQRELKSVLSGLKTELEFIKNVTK